MKNQSIDVGRSGQNKNRVEKSIVLKRVKEKMGYTRK